ncbi:MAG: SDR family oxidoreductase [Hyphomicrobiales bacterium]|nr:SDR family oxidoreductase [Hyphomicrobiales bacterium]MCP5373738.1 SDR family oxidoreductase [Hyphomicrobiales bacterium]
MVNGDPRRRFDLSGEVALCTGASSGIGRRMASALARAGADVVLTARSRDALAEAEAEITAAGPGRAAAIAADLSDRHALPTLAERTGVAFGAPTILVNAAGVNLRQSWREITPESWDATLNLNLATPFFLARALVPGMVARGHGRIINLASLQSFRAFPNGLAYGASKGGIAQLTRAMAEAWSSSGITANAIAPGFFETALTAPVFKDPDAAEYQAQRTAVGRNGEMPDLDGLTVFLASPAASYITGQVIALDGGYLAK